SSAAGWLRPRPERTDRPTRRLRAWAGHWPGGGLHQRTAFFPSKRRGIASEPCRPSTASWPRHPAENVGRPPPLSWQQLWPNPLYSSFRLISSSNQEAVRKGVRPLAQPCVSYSPWRKNRGLTPFPDSLQESHQPIMVMPPWTCVM